MSTFMSFLNSAGNGSSIQTWFTIWLKAVGASWTAYLSYPATTCSEFSGSLIAFLALCTENVHVGSIACHVHCGLCFKGDLLCKNHFYKVFEHSCVAAVCENNQPIMLKIHQLIFFIKPINHKQSLRTSCFRFSLCACHWGEKVPPICDAFCPISINTALSE